MDLTIMALILMVTLELKLVTSIVKDFFDIWFRGIFMSTEKKKELR